MVQVMGEGIPDGSPEDVICRGSTRRGEICVSCLSGDRWNLGATVEGGRGSGFGFADATDNAEVCVREHDRGRVGADGSVRRTGGRPRD